MSGDQNLKAFVDVINTQGEPGRTALNVKYLADFLAGKQGIITVTKYTSSGPLAFEYQNTPKVLIMPMFVQWDDQQTGDVENPDPAKAEPVAEAPAEPVAEVAAGEPPAADESHVSGEEPAEGLTEAEEEELVGVDD